MSNYCSQRSDRASLAQYFDCAIRGKSAFRTSLGPLDALEEFLELNMQRADGRRFTDESSRLHFVIVTSDDDQSAQSLMNRLKMVFAKRPEYPERITITLIAQDDVATLDEFLRAFGANGVRLSLSDLEWPWLNQFGLVPAPPCFDHPISSDCVFDEHAQGTQAVSGVIRACNVDPRLPCFSLQNAQICPKVSVNRGGCFADEGTFLELRCPAPGSASGITIEPDGGY